MNEENLSTYNTLLLNINKVTADLVQHINLSSTRAIITDLAILFGPRSSYINSLEDTISILKKEIASSDTPFRELYTALQNVNRSASFILADSVELADKLRSVYF